MVEKEFIDSLTKFFDRNLSKLTQEISSYQDELTLWRIEGNISNTAGNLCLHLCGNLQHYIGHILGGSLYNRDRENEFAAKNISKERLLTEINTTRLVVIETLKKLDGGQLNSAYPIPVFDFSMTTLFFLVHLQGHLNYHLGQINYHRRMVGHHVID